MKCKTCKKRMKSILTDFDYSCGGITKKAVRVPACQCPQCNDIIVPDIIMSKLKGYTAWEDGNIVDFAKHEEQETADFVALHMMGFM